MDVHPPKHGTNRYWSIPMFILFASALCGTGFSSWLWSESEDLAICAAIKRGKKISSHVASCDHKIPYMGMYQNQSCYIWEDEHPFTSYLGFTRVPRFWLIPIFWYHSIIVFYHYMLFELGVVLFWFHPFPNIFGIYCRCRLQKNLGVTRQGKRDLFFHV